jgi:FAD/FMN-containing dehydrogenase
MAFPSGHCPQVKLSGYLLGGGMSWNQGAWGHGCESVEAIEMVTAERQLITASKDENQDYFWAARGAGPDFFGVVTRFHLKLHLFQKRSTDADFSIPLKKPPLWRPGSKR